MASSKPFTHGHILGTDDNGHDVLSMLVYGARLRSRSRSARWRPASSFGGSLGLIAGYYKGAVDLVISTVFDVMLAVPALILALALASFLRGDPAKSHIPGRGRADHRVGNRVDAGARPHHARERAHVVAARVRDGAQQGAKNLRIMWREVLPNVIPRCSRSRCSRSAW